MRKRERKRENEGSLKTREDIFNSLWFGLSKSEQQLIEVRIKSEKIGADDNRESRIGVVYTQWEGWCKTKREGINEKCKTNDESKTENNTLSTTSKKLPFLLLDPSFV